MNISEKLERQIHRIHELLEGSNVDVTWNDRIPDPDNPVQLRQIHVTIHELAATTIECRLSRRAQDVKWIEELIGRRQSLGAHTVIAVASAGFTAGAKRKASRYGVLLRDLCALTEHEIASWGDQVTLIIYYYQYSDLTLGIGLLPRAFRKLSQRLWHVNYSRIPCCNSFLMLRERN
jgi:hypothetical protein